MVLFLFISRLEELKGHKILRFTMQEGITFDIPYENIVNYPDVEMIDAPESQFRCLYCSISSIHPVV